MTNPKSLALILGPLLFLANGCGARHPDQSDLFNQQAALTGDVPVHVLDWPVIASSVDRQHGTMSTLTGNEPAVKEARASAKPAYPSGAVLALATWTERDDPHWFGAKIPGLPQSIETVTVSSSATRQSTATYKRYAGSPLKEIVPEDAGQAAARKAYILAQSASVMP